MWTTRQSQITPNCPLPLLNPCPRGIWCSCWRQRASRCTHSDPRRRSFQVFWILTSFVENGEELQLTIFSIQTAVRVALLDLVSTGTYRMQTLTLDLFRILVQCRVRVDPWPIWRRLYIVFWSLCFWRRRLLILIFIVVISCRWFSCSSGSWRVNGSDARLVEFIKCPCWLGVEEGGKNSRRAGLGVWDLESGFARRTSELFPFFFRILSWWAGRWASGRGGEVRVGYPQHTGRRLAPFLPEPFPPRACTRVPIVLVDAFLGHRYHFPQCLFETVRAIHDRIPPFQHLIASRALVFVSWLEAGLFEAVRIFFHRFHEAVQLSEQCVTVLSHCLTLRERVQLVRAVFRFVCLWDVVNEFPDGRAELAGRVDDVGGLFSFKERSDPFDDDLFVTTDRIGLGSWKQEKLGQFSRAGFLSVDSPSIARTLHRSSIFVWALSIVRTTCGRRVSS